MPDPFWAWGSERSPAWPLFLGSGLERRQNTHKLSGASCVLPAETYKVHRGWGMSAGRAEREGFLEEVSGF